MADEKPIAAKGPVSLTSAAHKGVRVKEAGNANHIAPNHFAKVYTSEYNKAGVDYPIIFVKDPETENFISVGMWGLEPGENLFIEDGRWTGGYYPASVRCYPFAIQPDPQNSEHLFIGIYEHADVVNKEEGNLIFNEDGTESDWMKEVKEFLVRVFQQEELTKQFAKTLNELGLLVPQTLSLNLRDSDEKKEVAGFYIVDREKLNNLTDEQYQDLRKSGALEVIYYHLMSLDSLDKMLRKKNLVTKVGEEPKIEAASEESPSL